MTYEEFLKAGSVEGRSKLSVKWATGGASGGNCYDGEAVEWTYRGEEPEVREIDDLLAKVCPGISFLQYKLLVRDLEYTYGTDEDNEYYGNYTTYSIKSVSLRHLYDRLAAMNLLPVSV